MRKKKNKSFSKLYNNLCLSYKDKYKYPEEWKNLIYKGITTPYVVSNYGRIINTDKQKMPYINYHNKHYHADIILDNGKYIWVPVYRLVAMMFIDIPQKYIDAGYTMDDLVVDHIRDGDDDNFDDNTIWNLQWLTYRENTSKASKCGYRGMYPKEFRETLDNMILNDYDNNTIYKELKDKFGYDKEEMQAQVQVRRRRLDKVLYHPDFIYKDIMDEVDKYIKDGLSNKEICKIMNADNSKFIEKDGKKIKNPFLSLLHRRRLKYNMPANISKYFTNEESKEIDKLFERGFTTEGILSYFNMYERFPDKNDINKIKSTLASRKVIYKHKFNDYRKDTIEETSIGVTK